MPLRRYERWSNKPTELLRQVQKYVLITGGGHWLWQGATNNMGYGQIRMTDKAVYVHRAVYATVRGQMPQDLPRSLLIRHTCDLPLCCNPDHLVAGDQRDNMQDAVARQRIAVGEQHGSAKLTAPQVREMRERHAAGSATFAELAQEVGVSKQAVANAVRRKTWRHVQ